MATKTKTRTIGIEAGIPKTYQIEYWYENRQEMPEHEQQHVQEQLEDGIIMGQLVDENSTGWWKLVMNPA
ncbi:MAG: hypothetical protein Q8P59_07255 [Dehalococcoidia bacterium]|nr:hypothetical protein [Dehalococcoidia bacterium]